MFWRVKTLQIWRNKRVDTLLFEYIISSLAYTEICARAIMTIFGVLSSESRIISLQVVLGIELTYMLVTFE